MRFEWDPEKAAVNLSKHRIAFEDAARVFDDPLQRSRQDRTEGGELRWQTLGLVAGLPVLLLVAHIWREEEEGEEVIRIISARKANKRERRDYEQGQG